MRLLRYYNYRGLSWPLGLHTCRVWHPSEILFFVSGLLVNGSYYGSVHLIWLLKGYCALEWHNFGSQCCGKIIASALIVSSALRFACLLYVYICL